MAVKGELVFKISGQSTVSKELVKIEETVRDTRIEIERYRKSGGLSAMAVGQEKIDAAGKRVEALAAEIKIAANNLSTFRAQMLTAAEGSEEFLLASARIAQTEAQISSLRAELTQLPRDLRESVSDTAGFLGDIDTGLSTLAASVSAVGSSNVGRITGQGFQQTIGRFGGVAEPIDLASDVFAAAEALPRLSSALTTAKENILGFVVQAGRQQIMQQTLAASESELFLARRLGNTATIERIESEAALTATQATAATGVKALVVAYGPLIVTGAALVASVLLIQKVFSDASEGAKELADAERERIEGAVSTRNELRTLSVADAQTQKEDLEERLRLTIEARDKLVVQYDAMFKDVNGAVDKAETNISGVLTKFGINIGSVGNFVNELDGFNKDIQDMESELARISTEVIPVLEDRIKIEEAAKKALEESVSSAQHFVEARRRELELEQEVASASQTLSMDSTKERIATLQSQAELEQQLYDDIQRKVEENAATIQALQNSTDPDSQQIVSNLIEQNKVYEQSLNDLYPSIFKNNEALQQYQQVVLPTVQAREKEIAVLNENKQALAETSQELKQLTNQLPQLQDQLTTAVKARDNRLQQLAEEDALKRRRLEEDNRLNAREKNLVALRDANASRQRVQGIEAEHRNKIADINTKSANDSVKHLQEFIKQERTITDEAGKERLRKLQDLEDQLTGAADSRDFISFLHIQREGNKQLQRDAEDAGDDAQKRATSFNEEQQAADQARQQELQAEQQHYQERLATEQAGQQKIITIEEQFANLRSQLAARRAAEDITRQRQAQALAEQVQITTLQQQITTAQNRVARLSTPFGQVMEALGGNVMARLVVGASNRANQLLNQISANAVVSGGSARRFSFDQGGVTPTNALFKVHKDEVMSADISYAVLNKNTSRAFEAGMSQNISPSLQVVLSGNTFGGEMGIQPVIAELQRILVPAMEQMVRRVQNGR